jgi:uncharacterized repeat protein (TIGR03803 family)
MKSLKLLLLASAVGLQMTAADAARLTILHRFDGTDGIAPPVALTLGPDGRFYGTTIDGGQFARGTVFAIDPANGNFETLHHFASDEGQYASGQLLLASDGYLYGTTMEGGDDNINCAGGCGTVYRISASGDFTTSHFMTLGQGSSPLGGLIEGADGLLYGTTYQGGANGCGAVYAFSPVDSSLNVRHSFNCGAEGRFPMGRLVLATNGFLYGTTSEGAAGEEGTVFRLKPNGSHFETLVQFADADAGCQPKAGLIQARNGDLYGEAEDCGSYGAGALYAVTPKGAMRSIHHFSQDGYGRDGIGPHSELLEGPDGKLYGTAMKGGVPVDDPTRSGTVFSLTLKGTKFKVRHTFEQAPDGSTPTSGLTLGPDGNLYGVTPVGGNDPWPGKGTVYRLTINK